MRALTIAIALTFAVADYPAPAAVYVGPSQLWPGGIVPYEWGPEISGENQLVVLAAMQIWEDVANIDFTIRDGEGDYLFIRNAPPIGDDPGPSRSSIGRQGGRQNLNIRINLSGISVHGIAHEVGHSLGLYHTMQRTDREDFLEYYPERTSTGGQGNFDIASGSLAWPRDEMDYDSLMSYGRCTFANCAANTGLRCLNNTPEELDTCRNLRIRHPAAATEFERKMGQRSYLTRLDALAMSFLYPEPGWFFLETGFSFTQLGTFHHPLRKLDTAVDAIPVNSTLWAQPGDYIAPASGRITKRMTLRAPLGRVRIVED